MRNTILIILLLVAFAACSTPEGTERQAPATGDLLFVADTTGMGQAVISSTGRYSHVAIIERTDQGLFVWEAVPRKGVIRRGYEEFLCDNGAGGVTIVDVGVEFDTVRLMAELRQHFGQAYDDYFAAENGRCYCSELVEECYYDKEGSRVFQTEPMQFRDSAGAMPEFWERWFDSLGVAIPEGAPGTNPTQISLQVANHKSHR